MASKDITKVAIAGTAVVGLLLIYYLYTRKSRLQDADKKEGIKTKEKSPVKKSQTETEVKDVSGPEKKPESGQTKPKLESKIPQKIQSKPQGVVKPSLSEGSPAVTKPESILNQDGSKAGIEAVSFEKKDESKDGEPREKEIQNSEPVKKTEISSVQPKKQINAAMEKKTESSPPPVAAVQPVQAIQQPSVQQQTTVQQPSVEQPSSVPVQQPSSVQHSSSEEQHPALTAERPVYNAHDTEEVSIKSEASIILSSPTVSEQTNSTVNNTLSTDSPVKENGTESPSQNGTAPTPAASQSGLDVEKITSAIQQAKSNPASIDKETVDTLVMLLRQKDIPLLQASLDCIVRCAAFSQNQTLLRESGCIQEVTILLQIHAMAAKTGSETSQNLLGSLNNAIINLCMDIQNQARLEACIPILISLITYPRSPEDVQLMSLKSLTNLSTTPSYHDQYIGAIPRLFNMMDGVNSSIRLQAVKVLVNLSCNPEIIPDLLKSKTPRSILKSLEPQTDSILLLRVVTLLVNLVSCVKEGKIAEDKLPALDNPDYAGSIHMTLFSETESTELKMRIQSLTRHSTDNVSKQAIRLFEYIK